MAKRTCEGKTVKSKPCRANPLKAGTVLDGITVTGKWCRQHDQDLPDSARIGGAQPGSGRPRKPRPHELSQRLMEENLAVVEAPYWRTLGYDLKLKDGGGIELVPHLDVEGDPVGGAKVAATFQGMVTVSDVDDLGAQIEAAEKLKDRVYGRPKQEVTVAGDLPLHLEVTGAQIIGDPDARKHAGATRRRVGATRAKLPRRAGAGH